jgi:phosphatidylserine/phosphatidylglycerophosphate/cardiolipin synthase-like enzyme
VHDEHVRIEGGDFLRQAMRHCDSRQRTQPPAGERARRQQHSPKPPPRGGNKRAGQTARATNGETECFQSEARKR